MSKIIFVSSFIDIGRGDWSNGYIRSNEIYFNNFLKFYSELDINLILFCEEKTKIEIEKRITTDFKTKITFVLTDKSQIEYFSEIENVKIIQNSETFRKKILRDTSNPPEYSNPEYVLMMYAKTEFMKKAKSLNYIDSDIDTFCWIDFGIGHGHVSYINEIKNKKLRNREIKKCLFFNRQSLVPSSDPEFYFGLSDNVLICGGVFAIPLNYVDFFYDEFKKIVNKLINSNLIDDDQTILSIFTAENKDVCEIVDSRKYLSNPHGGDWFPIFELIE